MNYPEELRERWNECMCDERDIIQRFLEKQYDLRYGRQRDSWHFEDEIEVVSSQGSLVKITDIMLDKDCFVKFRVKAFGHDYSWWECVDFAYGELSKVIEALPDVNNILIENAKSDIANMFYDGNLINLEENPFKSFINGLGVSIYSVKYEDGHIKAYNYTGKDVMDETNTGLVLGLRNHINIEVLHRSNEYKEVMNRLALEPNLRKSVDDYDKTNYGVVTFTLYGTDVEFDLITIKRDDTGNLVIYGCDKDNTEDTITLTEKDIKKEYLEVILKWMTARGDIMDEYNGHDKNLVRQINAAWKSNVHYKMFGAILLAILCRDHIEYEQKFGEIDDYSEEWATNHAHEILEGVCDDLDLECVLKFVRF